MITSSGNETLTLLVRQLSPSGLCSLLLPKAADKYIVMLVQVPPPVDPALGLPPSDPRRVKVRERIEVEDLDDVLRVTQEWESQHGDMPLVMLEFVSGRGRWRTLSAPCSVSPMPSSEFAVM